ncbi:MAG: hypothetical protein KKE17_15655 [Proteobacteria bacterium]|nr:hypothetical protein [Pseudomonadota bacterium]
MRKEKYPPISYETASELWSHIRPLLIEWCVEHEICGDYRRKCKLISNINIVIIPIDYVENISENAQKLRNKINLTVGSSTTIVLESIDGPVNVTFYCASVDNFGSQMLAWTGDGNYNMILRGIAKNRGYLLNQYGLFKNCIYKAGSFEIDLFQELKISSTDPVLRNKRIK